MTLQRTLSILKPDATRRNLTGKINALIEGTGLKIVGQKRIQLSKQQAEAFYSVHGSDSAENAATEIRFFFSDIEICV